jgi:hypothetical protein
MFAVCSGVFAVGYSLQTRVLPAGMGTWTNLVMVWIYATPLWAVLTAWLGRDRGSKADDEQLLGTPVVLGIAPWASRIPPASLRGATWLTYAPELLRFAMCGSGVAFLVALKWGERWTWIPLVALTWLLSHVADRIERGRQPSLHLHPLIDFMRKRAKLLRHTLAVVLVFHYVCLAWVFFRAGSFETALAVLHQIARLEPDHANIVPVLTTALAVGFACHFFAEGSFRWLRERWAMLPWYMQGALLAGVTLVLRELAHPKVVPFIYFQF